jgi:hypothetical protein
MVSSDSAENALPSSSSSGHTADGEISDSDSSPEPPKKRLRCDSRVLVTDQQTQSRVIEPVAEIGDSDYSNHPNVRRPQPNRPDAESPRTGDDSRTTGDVNKELLTELSCEICFAIYYQPVTTPCQHVSLEPLQICHFLSPPVALPDVYGMAPIDCAFFHTPDVFISHPCLGPFEPIRLTVPFERLFA